MISPVSAICILLLASPGSSIVTGGESGLQNAFVSPWLGHFSLMSPPGTISLKSPVGGYTAVCDTWPMQCQSYSYLHSFGTLPSFRIGDRGTFERLAPGPYVTAWCARLERVTSRSPIRRSTTRPASPTVVGVAACNCVCRWSVAGKPFGWRDWKEGRNCESVKCCPDASQLFPLPAAFAQIDTNSADPSCCRC